MVILTGAKAIAKIMALQGIKHFFHVPGGISGFFPEIEDAGIDLVLTRSEKAATYVADGYSRISYKPSVCFGQAGPGAINLSAGLSEAFWTCTPVIALTGSTSTQHIYKFQYQELDEMPLFKPTTKWNAEIPFAERAGEIMRNAFKIATSGCPGPVHVNLHYDASRAEAEMPELYVDQLCKRYPSQRTRPDPDDVTSIAKVLADSERPVIVAGGGVNISQAWGEIIQLAELLTIPVATTLNGKGTIPDIHPLSVGVVGRYSKSTANKVVNDADVVFFVGSRAGGMTTDNWNVPKQNAKILQLDIEPEFIGRNYKILSSMVCDAKLGLQDLITTIKSMIKKPTPKGQYLKEIKKLIEEWEDEATEVMNSNACPIKPHRVIKEIRDVLGAEDILVADTGQMAAWTGALYKSLIPGRRYIRAAGTLGWSQAAALGAKFAAGERKVMAVIGDGGILYHISELETALRWNKPFVTLVLNNRSLGMIRLTLERLHERRGFNSTDFLDLDYGKIAEGFGAHGDRIEKPDELRESVQLAYESGKPSVIDVLVDLYELSPQVLYRSLPSSRQL